MDRLTKQQLLELLPEQYRHFLNITATEFRNGAIQPILYFAEAFNLFCSFTRIDKPADIHFFATDKGKITSDYYEITFTPLNHAIHIHQNNSIYFNLHRASQYSKAIQIACYLEELAHCYMNITDEVLVKKVVAEMYSEILYDKQEDCYKEIA